MYVMLCPSVGLSIAFAVSCFVSCGFFFLVLMGQGLGFCSVLFPRARFFHLFCCPGQEITRGWHLTKGIEKGITTWADLFQRSDFFWRFEMYIQVPNCFERGDLVCRRQVLR